MAWVYPFDDSFSLKRRMRPTPRPVAKLRHFGLKGGGVGAADASGEQMAIRARLEAHKGWAHDRRISLVMEKTYLSVADLLGLEIIPCIINPFVESPISEAWFIDSYP